MARTTHRGSLTLLASLAMAACATRAEHASAERGALRQQAAQEIDRICALPEPERQEEVRKIEEESGLELQCARQ